MTQTIGQQLKAEREEKRLTLEKVFEATKIRIQYLQALEADDLSVMPSPVQARGYLRNYAEYLGLDFDQMLAEKRNVKAGQVSNEIIGPADNTSTLQQDDDSLNVQPATQTMEPSGVLAPDSSFDATEETPVFVEEQVLLTKPKPARRKKTDGYAGEPKAASTESSTKRRGRKKIEPELESVPIVESEPVVIEESLIVVESDSKPEGVQEPAVVIDSVSESPVKEMVEEQQDLPKQSDLSDNLWQSWLNRLGSVLAARMKRRMLVQREAAVAESELETSFMGSDVISGVETQNLAPENSNAIFVEIGNELRKRRELLSLHLDEVERNTHVKAHYLEALEKGAMDDLPSTVQTRGMLSNYATFLDLDVDALLLRFADALQARYRERNPQKPARKSGQPIIANIPPIRSFIAGDMIFGVGMVVLLVGFAIWGVSRVMAIQSQRAVQPTAPSISDVLLASPDPSLFTATPTLLPVESFPGEATVTVVIPTQNINAEVQLNLVAVERTYMRVIVDGEVAFEGRVVPGNAYPYEAEQQIEVLVGSGAAIRIVYNGRDLGLMGTFGQVLNNIYRSDEIITPTPLATPSVTITVSPTATIPPTPTLNSTNTAVPSSTSSP